MPTKCGAYGTIQSPTNESKEILTSNLNNLTSLHEKLNNLSLEHLLENHTFSTQVVAGLNYKFSFVHNEHNVVIVIWRKLDNSFEVSLKELRPL
jgi:hypothetical protein